MQRKACVWFALIAVASVCLELAPVTHASGNAKGSNEKPAQLLAGVSGPVTESVTEALEGYGITILPDAVHAANPRHRFAVRFAPSNVNIVLGTETLSLRYLGCAKEWLTRAVEPDNDPMPVARGNRVEYLRGTVVEWYANGPFGLQQGFEVTQPPEQTNGRRPLRLGFEIGGSLVPTLDDAGRKLVFRNSQGEAMLTYAGLAAWDATGKDLAARLVLSSTILGLEIEDAEAQYPITIDPFLQQAKLTAADVQSDSGGGPSVGISVGISGDTVVAGAPGADDGTNNVEDAGAAYVFVKPSLGWADMTQTAKLIASDGQAGDNLGVSVAISGDVVVVGKSSLQKVYVFVKPSGGWTDKTEDALLLLPSGVGHANAAFGYAVAISQDTIVVAAPFTNVGSSSQQGVAYVFTEPGGGWSGTIYPSATLKSSDAQSFQEFGLSVSISGDTIVSGARSANVGSNAAQGAAYVFVKPLTGWSGTLMQNAKLLASDGASGDKFGKSVSISNDTVVVGASDAKIGSNFNQGSAYVFVKPSSGWTGTITETAKLLASDGTTGDGFGWSASVSGSVAAIGAPFKNDQGAAYVFVESGGVWTEAAKLVASDASTYANFAFSVGINGHTVVAGAQGAQVDGDTVGAAYVYGDSSNGNASPTVTPSPPTATPTTPSASASPQASSTPTLANTGNATPTASVIPTRSATITTSPTGTPTVTPTRSQFETEAGDFACSDGFDNDGNGRTDCSDPRCAQSIRCAAPVPVAGAHLTLLFAAIVAVLGALGIWRNVRPPR